jgi:hypothetical protein
MATYTFPGVYIEELPATGPIEGVGTSTAAFIGPAMSGPLAVPTKVTSWTDFKRVFGDYITLPRVYLANAVEGFFKNGGTVAYMVRVGTARRASLPLNDHNGVLTLRVEALNEGPAGNLITVQTQDSQIVTTASALRAAAPMLSGVNSVIRLQNLADAARFRPGDTVGVVGTAQRAVIDRITGDQLFLATALTAVLGAGTVRIADLAPGQTSFRVQNLAGLETGHRRARPSGLRHAVGRARERLHHGRRRQCGDGPELRVQPDRARTVASGRDVLEHVDGPAAQSLLRAHRKFRFRQRAAAADTVGFDTAGQSAQPDEREPTHRRPSRQHRGAYVR